MNRPKKKTQLRPHSKKEIEEKKKKSEQLKIQAFHFLRKPGPVRKIIIITANQRNKKKKKTTQMQHVQYNKSMLTWAFVFAPFSFPFSPKFGEFMF